ncbi:MAG: 2-oxoacid:acceptor oxidoreductase family protein [Candidatus Caldarchaeum sp.]|uniref:pyruvate synthase n=1 Tax=Caldiarchaeum subterraneum TaxID=311458 RepID=A0A7C4E058_CALS0|nr:2-oxoacid:acceptor oxidoreductase family protein [Candidatus Caldarchaeales archaeon]
MLRIRFHGRGGQGVKTSSRILGRAAFSAGFFAQDFPIYGAERRGAPVTAFTRISHSPIMERGYIFNPHIVVVMDETLLADAQARPLEDLPRGGVALINSARGPIFSEDQAGHVFMRINFTDPALRIIGKPIVSVSAAAAAAKLCGLRKQHVEEAVREELSELGVRDELLEKNLMLMSETYDNTPRYSIKVDEERVGAVELVDPASGRVVYSDVFAAGNAVHRATGNWRVFRPVVDYGKCTGCKVCFIYCPDSAISLDAENKPVIDYEHCKGCLICVVECPIRAISSVREVEIFA